MTRGVLSASRSTGKERDTESGNDYFKYRYYGSSMGRWLSPDPSGLTHADLENPQSLNLYNYVGNNPLTRVDLDGLCWQGFQWACNFGQIVRNTWDGYGPHTDAGVEKIYRQGISNLRQHGLSAEGMSRLAVMNAAGKAGKTWQSYLKRHPTLQTYSGRTSGTGTPEEKVQLRDRGHHMNEEGYGEAELDKSSTNSDAIRGREQQNIERFGGARSQGGTSGNAINGISETNPNKARYMNAANAEFGAAKTAATEVEETIEVIEILNDMSDIP